MSNRQCVPEPAVLGGGSEGHPKRAFDSPYSALVANARFSGCANRAAAAFPSRLLVLVLAAVVSPWASAATYYVSTAGNDSNAGMQSAPFRHISKAAATATSPGDTVIVMDGTYDNEGVTEPNFVVTLQYSGTAGNPITFKAQNRGRAILDSMNTSTTTACNGAAAYFNLYNAAYVVIQGFVIQHSCDSGIQSNDNAHDITIRWNEIRNIANHTVTDQYGRDGIYLNSNEYNFTFDGNIFHDIGRTGGQALLHFDHGIYSSSTNITVINNLFYNMNRGYSIQLSNGASTWLIANNTFAFGDGNGDAGDIMFWGTNSGITMRNNIFYNPNVSALTQFYATISGCAFDHNLVFGGSIMSGSTSGIAVGTNQIGPDPLFVNSSPSSPNFQLQSGSPGIAAGLAVAAVVGDIVGTTRPATPDVGAYQIVAVQALPVLSSIFTSSVTSSSVFINWSTNKTANSYVQYGPSGYTSTTPANASMVTQHSVALSNLAAGTLYHFRAASQDSVGNLGVSSDFTFTTAAAVLPPPLPPPPSTTFSLATNSAATVVAGQSFSATVSASLLTGTPASVSFSAAGLPLGGITFSTGSCTINCSTTATITVPANTTPGLYHVAFTASGAGTSASSSIAVTVTAPSSGVSNISSGLMARWMLNETSGTLARDSSGYGNHGGVANGYWWPSSNGPAIYLAGNGYIRVNESPTLEMTNQLTVSFWLSPRSNSNVDPRVIEKLYDWDVKLNGANRYPQFEISGGQYLTLNYSFPLYTWHHITFTFANGITKGYVDGVAAPVLQNTFNGSLSLAQFAYGLNLGTDASLTNWVVGGLSDVRLFNRALSPTDVAALYLSK
jgi:hypothetical protein